MRKKVASSPEASVYVNDSPKKHKEIFNFIIENLKSHGEFHSSTVFAHGDYEKHLTNLCAVLADMIFEIEFKEMDNFLGFARMEDE